MSTPKYDALIKSILREGKKRDVDGDGDIDTEDWKTARNLAIKKSKTKEKSVKENYSEEECDCGDKNCKGCEECDKHEGDTK